MTCNDKFYVCKHCGNIIKMIKDTGVPVICCSEPMSQIKPNIIEASKEKHIPTIEVNGSIVTVNIGSVPHPMTEEHLIEWVVLVTKQGRQHKALTSKNKPNVKFAITEDDKVIKAYIYCNLHGLWESNYQN